MKTNEQIGMAQEIIKSMQDYIELAKVEKKLKMKENSEVVAGQIETIKEVSSRQIINL